MGEEFAGAGVGDVGETLFVAGAGFFGGGFVAEDTVGCGEECLKFGIELCTGNLCGAEPTGEDVEGCGLSGRQGAVRSISFESFKKAWDECVDLVVGASAVFCEAEDSNGVCFDVVGYGAELLVGLDYYMTILCAFTCDESAFQTGELSADHFNFVAFQELYVGGMVVRKSVGVGTGDYSKCTNCAVAYCLIASFGCRGIAVDYKGKAFSSATKTFYLIQRAVNKDVVVYEWSTDEMDFTFASFGFYNFRSKDFQVGAVSGVE